MKIASAASAFPKHYYSQKFLLEALQQYWGDSLKKPQLLERLHRNVTVEGRHLALPAEENYFVENLVGILILIFVLQKRVRQSMALLQDGRRFYLIHQAVFTLERITHGASHMGFHCLPFFGAVKKLFWRCHNFRITEAHSTFTVN